MRRKKDTVRERLARHSRCGRRCGLLAAYATCWHADAGFDSGKGRASGLAHVVPDHLAQDGSVHPGHSRTRCAANDREGARLEVRIEPPVRER